MVISKEVGALNLLTIRRIMLAVLLRLAGFMDPGSVPKRYEAAGVGVVVTVFEKFLRLC